MKNFRNQQGVALLFALGMLTILLVTGMAFVANALTAQKVAANNSARTQSRMFAQSAISRVLASIMLYQQRIFNRGGDSNFPEKFDSVYSFSGTSGDNDGLTGSTSLMRLPTDSTVVAENVAVDFNRRFESWNGKWVYFYDTVSGDDKQIIGRAAWQVLSSAPQILAPVFLSGHLETDGTTGWYPNRHRWGREIDEVNVANSPIFRNAVNASTGVTDKTAIKDFTANLYPILQSAWEGTYSDTDAVKRWIETWLMPDVRGANVLDPVPVIPEVYSAMDGNRKRQYLRFNISEILKDNLSQYGSGISENSDPWYARFGINSTAASVAGNNLDALNKLTANSPEAAIGDSYDYKLAADDRPSLPFLRRIGNFAVDKPTFANPETWRKQIAANFNDYCDADSVPTSDQAPSTWATYGAEKPTFTGNEKTPYLYEMGFGLGFVSTGDKVTANAGFAKSTNSYDETNHTLTTSFNSYLNLKLYAKLANIYPLVNADSTNKYYADCKPSKVQLWFKPVEVELKVSCNYKTAVGTNLDNETAIPVEISDSKLSEFNKTFIASHEYSYSSADENDNTHDVSFSSVDNSSGNNPYPVSALTGAENHWGRIRQATFSADSGAYPVSSTLTYDKLKDLKGESLIPDGCTDPKVTKIEVVVKKVKVIKVQIETERAVLGYKNGTAVTNVDFVRGFDSTNPLVWNNELTEANAKELDFSTLSGDGAKYPTLVLGGVLNHDPRQNLNPLDWERTMRAETTNALQPTVAELAKVMDINDSGVGQPNGKTDSNYEKFSPKSTSDSRRDKEVVAFDGDDNSFGGPGWRDNAAGEDDSKRLSTAFIRNAPMMSPWEIGLIHRGVKWQTLNIKCACDPNDNNNSISLKGHEPTENWTSAGTSYEGGDGGILDQIKMTDQCSTYGKINVNKLRSNYAEFNATYDKEIVRALFDQLRYDQQINNFYVNSKRDASENLSPNVDNGTLLSYSDTIFNNITASRTEHTSRANFLDWESNGTDLTTAFGGVGSDGDTDAAREEIVGKTINLLCAESVAPTQIYVVIVAQSIRDVGGFQSRQDINGDTKTKSDCDFGQFDVDLGSATDPKDDVYFDEITGEVKMFVTIDRDINTGRMTVRRIDYLE